MVIRGASAVGLLRLLLAGSVVALAVLLGLDAWFSYHAIFRDEASDAARVCEIAREHAANVFNSQELVARRVEDRLAGLDDDTIRNSERSLRDAFVQMIATLPQIGSLLVVDAHGHALLATAAYPVNRMTDYSDRDYFVALKAGTVPTFLSRLQVSRVDGKTFFGLGRRLQTPEGGFGGVVDIAILPRFFETFWETLAGEHDVAEDRGIVALIRDDGAILAMWPPSNDRSGMAGPTFVASTQRQPAGGTFTDRSPFPGGIHRWTYTYRKVQGYPAVAVVAHSDAAVRAMWLRQMAVHLAIGVPTAAALWLLGWTAMRRAVREEAALAQMQAEMERREAAEATLLRSQRIEALGQLTGGVAHDFNNLLTIMLGNFEMISRAPERVDRTARLARAGMAAAQRGAELTAKLLAFSRRRAVRSDVVNVNRLLEEFKPVLRQGVTEAISLVYELAPALWRAKLDQGQLEAAVLNLVGNARDAMANGGTITITTSNVILQAGDLIDQPGVAPGEYVRVAVADNGSGMDPSVASRATEPFFTTKEIGQGTGLGLAQVYGFCQQAGGGMRIRSVAGEGTVVEVLLPRATQPEAERGAAAAAPSFVADPAGRVVLVVEDDAAVLDVAVASVADLGYATLTAADAAQALRLLGSTPRIDILFSDVVLPGGTDGVQLAIEAKRLKPTLKVILVSGYAAGAGDRKLPPGVVVLPKPYRRDDLAVALGRLAST